ncbi:D-alanyl-D-alanine carboxypeptidase family protein [Microbacterium sp. MAHUQ-60]|uniref:D-alanyl-D-alanine carboxypeptidase family protein n=1 Tax=unclassified Microbacterium TaxID=2609290 RepID=UPI00361D80C1
MDVVEEASLPGDQGKSGDRPEPDHQRDPGDQEQPGHSVAAGSAAWADAENPTTALTWLDTQRIATESASETQPAPDLFAGARLTPGWRRPRALLPVGIIVALGAAYAGGTLLCPLDAVAPTITAEQVAVESAPAATVAWPTNGSAAVGVQGMSTLASTTDRDEIASITKIASAMMVLEKLPLEVGEQGPSFAFTRSDRQEYLDYRWGNQSSLDVPVDGSLTEYQMLQGILLGSANNYIDRLARELWGSEQAFADAAKVWLSDHGIEGISLESPSGFDRDNVASPAAVVRLGEVAMAHPVLAEIVGTRSAEIPGVGTVTNTNQMLEDDGVVGMKTGTLSHWNLLTAKDVPSGDTTVRLFAAVLGQDSNADRVAVTRQLFAGVEKSLADQPVSVPKGTVVGQVTTEWGDRVDVVTDADAKVVLWNGASATATPELELGATTAAGSAAGRLVTEGPVDTVETRVSLAKAVTAPSIWWRLTHPLELFGIDNG